MSGDGTSLIIISGYNFDHEDQTLPSTQNMATKGPQKEEIFPSHSRLSAAVTLGNGTVVVTGGRGSEKQVWMSLTTSSLKWGKRHDMMEGRKGHAAAAVSLDNLEVMIVAGGWGFKGKELDSVHLYNTQLDKWSTLPRMMAPRVDFSLQVQYWFLKDSST